MPILDPARSLLLVIDIQARLAPAIHGGEAMIANACRLAAAASLLDVPALFTEQNAAGLGHAVPDLAPAPDRIVHKMSFDAVREPGFLDRIGAEREVVVAGCEAHVCVLQTVLGLLEAGRSVQVAADAVGSRDPANRDAALARMSRHGAGIVTTEMVVFEWLGTARHPHFRDCLALVR